MAPTIDGPAKIIRSDRKNRQGYSVNNFFHAEIGNFIYKLHHVSRINPVFRDVRNIFYIFISSLFPFSKDWSLQDFCTRENISMSLFRCDWEEVWTWVAHASFAKAWIFYTTFVPNKFAKRDKMDTIAQSSSIENNPKTFGRLCYKRGGYNWESERFLHVSFNEMRWYWLQFFSQFF